MFTHIPTPTKNDSPLVGRGSLMLPEPVGELHLLWSAKGLIAIAREPLEGLDEVRVFKRIPAVYSSPLRAYAKGKDIAIEKEIPVDLRGTEFQRTVWSALRKIPRGSVASYGEIARTIQKPRAFRAIGMANSRNPIPIVVPCHRVVASGGKLGGYTGGLDRKRALLLLEGVQVNAERVQPGQLTFGDY